MSIDIALVDSGVNPWHSHVQGIAGGVCFKEDDAGEIVKGSSFHDELGHGTAIAGIIREKVPDACLYAVKIFHKEIKSSVNLLLEAIDWAIRKQVHIIHLSLGTEKKAYRKDIEKLCLKAYEKDIVIIAAARDPNDQVYPGIFQSVIGAYWHPNCEKGEIVFHPDNLIEFGANGQPRAIPGIDQKSNFRGSSFAAAHVTGMAAQFLEKNPAGGFRWVKDNLIRSSLKISS